jgi:O-acetyl-ADP-ribose deacetylase (regulator of RNase III)
MPINYVHGDIFNSRCSVIVNPVNEFGVMGAGLALKFKQRYPALHSFYVNECKNGKLTVFHPSFWRGSGRQILLFATKKHWRDPSRLEYIAFGLEWLVANYQRMGITSIAFPKLGCGLGQLDWEEVKEIMELYLADLPITVDIYI